MGKKGCELYVQRILLIYSSVLLMCLFMEQRYFKKTHLTVNNILCQQNITLSLNRSV